MNWTKDVFLGKNTLVTKQPMARGGLTAPPRAQFQWRKQEKTQKTRFRLEHPTWMGPIISIWICHIYVYWVLALCPEY